VTSAARADCSGSRIRSTPLRWRPAAIVATGALVAACATPPHELPGALISGRLAVQVDGDPPRGFNGDFELRGDARSGSLRLTGPLGTTAADARWSPTQTWLVTAQSSTTYASLDELTAAAFGEPIPVAPLFDWLRGRPWPGAPAVAIGGSTSGFEQLGWRVDLSRWADGLIEARRDAPPRVTVRARVEPAA
jgi:outer membrane lipoprotein LolB